jgi:hypothetical protein
MMGLGKTYQKLSGRLPKKLSKNTKRNTKKNIRNSMARVLSEAQVEELLSNPAWKELIERVKKLRDDSEYAQMTSPDPFTHGKGVGYRQVCNLVISLPEILRKEILGESTGYQALRDKVLPFKK